MNISDGEYIKHNNDMYYDMFYIEEEKRGFDPEENHIVPGRYEVEVEPNEEIYIANDWDDVYKIVCFFVCNREMI